ncbi:MAG: polysaccharide biosynthesis protein [Ruminococcaceae bacterium]|nr:polysaccharide biosynthesis protein [Oscillospiraceae bacterium]
MYKKRAPVLSNPTQKTVESKPPAQASFGAFVSRHRKAILMLFDIVVLIICYVLPWVLIQGRISWADSIPMLVSSCFLFVCCVEISFGVFGMYDSLWRYAEIVEFFRLVLAFVVGIAAFFLLSLFIFNERRIPLSVFLLSALFAVSITLYSRLTYRMYRNTRLQKRGRRKRVMVVGAGEAAATLLHEQQRNAESDMSIICVVDDAPEKVGRSMMGAQIMGTTDDIPELTVQCEIDTIVVAIPSLDDENRQRILNQCYKTKCNLRILPDLRQIMTEGGDLSSRIREVRVEDLLGREPVTLSSRSATLLAGRVVMVTGAGGSIGSELCRQIAQYSPRRLIMLDIYENGVYSIQQELLREYGDTVEVRVEIASVRDTKKVNDLFDRLRPDVVFHAAAHKHVPLMEDCPEEAVKNNVCGTFNMATAADKYGTSRFVLVSTDKAVNPTSVMGATKRLCEMIVQAMAQKSKTTFVAVRFGNVLGSNGSVLPLFKEQIAAGGPLTVTHPEIVRYFMTIPEAVSLVLEAGAMGKGGEIFVLDMGQPVPILELAENLIRLAGFIPYEEIDIVFTGLRPGEKLYEELMMDEEGLRQTENNKISIGSPIRLNKNTFFHHIATLKEIAYSNNSENLVQVLMDMVPTFQHESGTVEG